MKKRSSYSNVPNHKKQQLLSAESGALSCWRKGGSQRPSQSSASFGEKTKKKEKMGPLQKEKESAYLGKKGTQTRASITTPPSKREKSLTRRKSLD